MDLMEVMNLPLLRKAKVIAGLDGMQRTVESVNMMDAPDIIQYLKTHELLVTTAYAIKERLDELLELVHQMALKGCAGLGIKTKRYIFEIPAPVIKLANELAFPIIEIPLEAPLGEVTTQIISHISEKLRQKAMDESAKRMKHAFFADFLDGQILSEEEIINRGRHYGLEKGTTYQCIMAGIDHISELYSKKFVHHEESIIQFKDQVYDHIDQFFSSILDSFIFVAKGHYFVLFIPDTSNQTEDQDWSPVLRSCQDMLYHSMDITLSFGVGSQTKRLIEIPQTYQKASEALQIGYQLKKTRFIQSYRVKGLSELLRMIPTDKLKQFYETKLKALAEFQDREHLDLLQTLNVYLQNQGQIAETAKQLYIHRNTVSYRLLKCEEILGISLKDSNEILELRIALLVGEWIEA